MKPGALQRLVDAAFDLAESMQATGWDAKNGLTVGPPEAEVPAVLIEREPFNELCAAIKDVPRKL